MNDCIPKFMFTECALSPSISTRILLFYSNHFSVCGRTNGSGWSQLFGSVGKRNGYTAKTSWCMQISSHVNYVFWRLPKNSSSVVKLSNNFEKQPVELGRDKRHTIPSILYSTSRKNNATLTFSHTHLYVETHFLCICLSTHLQMNSTLIVCPIV